MCRPIRSIVCGNNASKKVCLCVGVLVFLFCQNLIAQNETLKESQRAVVVFGFQPHVVGPFVNMTPYVQPLPREFFDGLTYHDIADVRGSINFPEKLSILLDRNAGDDWPSEFRFYLRFHDMDKAQRLEENLRVVRRLVATSDTKGRPVFRFRKGSGPQNVSIVRIGKASFEFIHDNYQNQRRDELGSRVLREEDHRLSGNHVGIDVAARPRFFAELIEFVKESRPEWVPLVAWFKDAELLTASLRIQQREALTIRATGRDVEAAKRLKVFIEKFIVDSKKATDQYLKRIRMSSRFTQPLVDAFDVWKPSLNGTIIELSIEKPKNLSSIVTMVGASLYHQRKNELRQQRMESLAAAVVNYNKRYNRLPFNVGRIKGQNNDLGWRVRLLPFVKEFGVFEKADLSKSHSEKPNSELSPDMPSVFGADDYVIEWVDSGVEIQSLDDISDGPSNTIMFIEYRSKNSWKKNEGVSIDQAVLSIRHWAPHEKVWVGFYDGTTRKLSHKNHKPVLEALMTPRGNEKVKLEELK